MGKKIRTTNSSKTTARTIEINVNVAFATLLNTRDCIRQPSPAPQNFTVGSLTLSSDQGFLAVTLRCSNNEEGSEIVRIVRAGDATLNGGTKSTTLRHSQNAFILQMSDSIFGILKYRIHAAKSVALNCLSYPHRAWHLSTGTKLAIDVKHIVCDVIPREITCIHARPF